MKWGDASGCLVPEPLAALVERERAELERRHRLKVSFSEQNRAEDEAEDDIDDTRRKSSTNNTNRGSRESGFGSGTRAKGGSTKNTNRLMVPNARSMSRGSVTQLGACDDDEDAPEPPLELPTQQFDGFDSRLYAAVAAFLERLLYEKLLCADD